MVRNFALFNPLPSFIISIPPRPRLCRLCAPPQPLPQAVLAMQAADEGGGGGGGEEGGWNDDLGEGFWAEADCFR